MSKIALDHLILCIAMLSS